MTPAEALAAAFYAAMRRWNQQRDDDPNYTEPDEILRQALAASGWHLERDAVDRCACGEIEGNRIHHEVVLALLGRALAHLGGPIRADIEDFLRRHDAQPGGGG